MHTPDSLNFLPPNAEAEPKRRRKRGKWIVVDDDPMTRAVIALVLKDVMRIEVIECNSGDLAWDVWRTIPGIEGVVTDLHMPGMNGLDLAERVHAHTPDAPIIMVTACPEDADWTDPRRIAIRRVVSKPFTCADLVTAMRETLQSTTWLEAA